MERQTVDFGIDLGTTNSEIAVLEGTTSRVIRTNENAEYTPSAVSFDKRSRLKVGQEAKNQKTSDDETEVSDIRLRFKLSMGHPEPLKAFKVNGKQMTPEELSAEVLKKLRADVQRREGEEIISAAISVPAVFEFPQCSATDRAAKLAGLLFSPLVQEPVAAALSYGFQTTSDRVFWMVYDFGGGTFDAAILQVRDEQIQVVNHGGDNHLGGGLIDAAIINQLLVPVITKEFRLSSDDRLWETIRSKLEYFVEIAKIRLSVEDKTDIEVRPLFLAKDGASPKFEYELKRSDVERLAEPFIERSINLCRSVLEGARLSSSDIEKLILVGGPTLMPLFRDMLTQKLGIALEFRVNPLTVVACGAAVFAGTQIIPEQSRQQVSLPAGYFKLELDYKPVGDETEPTVGGRVIAPQGQSPDGYTIEFVESKTAWRSGRLHLGTGGTFVSTIHADRDRRNEFLIELRDATGNLCQTAPDRFFYTIGITISAQTLVNNIGIGLANGDVLWLLEKATALPCKKRDTGIYTTEALKSGDSGTILRIPVVEGKNKRADRNMLVGWLEVTGQNIARDVPAGSPIEVTIAVDESRIPQVIAYVPRLDEEFENILAPKFSPIDKAMLIDHAEKAKTHLQKVHEQAKLAGSARADDLLKRIEDEQLVGQIDVPGMVTQQEEQEALDRCERRRIELDARLDEIEELINWPVLVAEAEAQIAGGRDIVKQYGDSQDAAAFSRLAEETKKAIGSRNTDSVRQKTGNLTQLIWQVLMKHPGWWVGQLEHLEKEYKGNMSNQAEADRLLAQGHRAITNQDVESLKTAVRQLWGLLPNEVVEQLRGYKSTVIKGGF
ncbi:MAG: Hsp70 family protein [Phycisphaerae bacterium]|nr:Hsp70 family protein [Phycisphaerae bacterium]